MPQVKGNWKWVDQPHTIPDIIEVKIDNTGVVRKNEIVEAEGAGRVMDLHLQGHRTYLQHTAHIRAARREAEEIIKLQKLLATKLNFTSGLLVREATVTNSPFSPSDPFSAAQMRSKLESLEADIYEAQRLMDLENDTVTEQNTRRFSLNSSRNSSKQSSRSAQSSRTTSEGSSSQASDASKRRLKRSNRSSVSDTESTKDIQLGRTYHELRHLSDINKVYKREETLMKARIKQCKVNTMSNYNDHVKQKLKMFHTKVENFKTHDNAKDAHESETPPYERVIKVY